MRTSDTEATARDLGRAIEVKRTVKGWKRKDLASRSGLSYPYISEIENGAKEPSAKALRQIADALGSSVAELIVFGESLTAGDTAAQYDEGTQTSDRHTDAPRGLRDSELAAFLVSTQPTSVRTAAAQGLAESADALAVFTADQLAIVQAMINRALADFAANEMPQLVADEIQRRFASPAPGGGHRD